MKRILTVVSALALMSFTTAVFASEAQKPVVIADDATVAPTDDVMKKHEKALKAEGKAAKEKVEAEAKAVKAKSKAEAKAAKAKIKAEAKEAKAKIKAAKAKAKTEADAAKESTPAEK